MLTLFLSSCSAEHPLVLVLVPPQFLSDSVCLLQQRACEKLQGIGSRQMATEALAVDVARELAGVVLVGRRRWVELLAAGNQTNIEQVHVEIYSHGVSNLLGSGLDHFGINGEQPFCMQTSFSRSQPCIRTLSWMRTSTVPWRQSVPHCLFLRFFKYCCTSKAGCCMDILVRLWCSCVVERDLQTSVGPLTKRP